MSSDGAPPSYAEAARTPPIEERAPHSPTTTQAPLPPFVLEGLNAVSVFRLMTGASCLILPILMCPKHWRYMRPHEMFMARSIGIREIAVASLLLPWKNDERSDDEKRRWYEAGLNIAICLGFCDMGMYLLAYRNTFTSKQAGVVSGFLGIGGAITATIGLVTRSFLAN